MSFVYVPYCSGDLHAGDREGVTVANVERQFKGYSNMSAFLERLVPTFSGAQRVVLTGISAGGFGATLNYDHVASAFGAEVDTILMDDSGPLLAAPYAPECLQQHFYDTWGYADTIAAGCPDCQEGNFTEAFVEHLLGKYPDARLGLISSAEDATITNLLGFGLDDCVNLQTSPLDYDLAEYTAGLEDLRDRVAAGSSGFRLFLIPGDEHVFLDNALGSVNQDGTALTDWIAQALAGDAAWANVPAP